jgi:predicted DNA-binding transcriptional regulator YafY
MSQAARLLEVLFRLRARPRFTVQELADTLGVSRRTMLRDLHALSAMGVPLVATPGPGGGYALARDQRLPPPPLTVRLPSVRRLPRTSPPYLSVAPRS